MSDNKNSQGESIKREVGERMRKARKSMGLTQEQFGERAGDARIANRLSLYETGRDHMSMLTFFRISKALGLTPNELSPLELLPEGASVILKFVVFRMDIPFPACYNKGVSGNGHTVLSVNEVLSGNERGREMSESEYMRACQSVMHDYPDVMTTQMVCSALHIDRKTVYRLVASGELPGAMPGKGYRISKANVLNYLKVQHEKEKG